MWGFLPGSNLLKRVYATMKGIPLHIVYRNRHDIHRTRVVKKTGRRTFKRYMFFDRVFLKNMESGFAIGRLYGHGHNLSSTGMAFTTSFSLTEGNMVLVSFKLGKEIKIKAIVIWIKKSRAAGPFSGFIVGVRFVEPLEQPDHRYLMTNYR